MIINKFMYSVCSLCVLLNFSCQTNSDFPLDPFFESLKENSPEKVLREFKATPLDSAVINYDDFPEIFEDAATIVLQDSSQVLLFETYCEENGISLTYKQDYYTIVAAFHKRLNNEMVDIQKLNQEMIELSNRPYEQKHSKPDLH